MDLSKIKPEITAEAMKARVRASDVAQQLEEVLADIEHEADRGALYTRHLSYAVAEELERRGFDVSERPNEHNVFDLRWVSRIYSWATR